MINWFINLFKGGKVTCLLCGDNVPKTEGMLSFEYMHGEGMGTCYICGDCEKTVEFVEATEARMEE